jgi:hypothetical protein
MTDDPGKMATAPAYERGARSVPRALRGLSVARLAPVVLVMAIFAMAVRMPADSDTWWHLKSGQLMWTSGQILRSDPFSYTMAGQPWINHSWLAQIGLWCAYRLGGLPALALGLALAVTLAWSLVYRQSEGQPYVAAFLTLLGALASSVIWIARPQIMSFLLAAVIAWLLNRFKRTGSRWVWLVPPLVVIWANSHGGYILALILIGCHVGGEGLNRLLDPDSSAHRTWRSVAELASLGVISVLAVVLNPYGSRMWTYPLATVRIGPLQAFIEEWAAPDFHRLIFHPFVWLLLLLLVALGRSRRQADWTDLALVAAFGYLGLLASRNVALFALVAVPVLSRHAADALRAWPPLRRLVDPPPRRPSRPQVWLNAALLLLVAAGATTKVGTDLNALDRPSVWGEGLPVDAAGWLAHHPPPGNMFNTYNWGGYLIWALYPDQPVFIDGRTDLYSLDSRVLEDYSTVHWIRPGWQEVLDRYGVGFVLTERAGLLDTLLAQIGDWSPVYVDDIAVIYQRQAVAP